MISSSPVNSIVVAMPCRSWINFATTKPSHREHQDRDHACYFFFTRSTAFDSKALVPITKGVIDQFRESEVKTPALNSKDGLNIAPQNLLTKVQRLFLAPPPSHNKIDRENSCQTFSVHIELRPAEL